jgi:hypothetical protein
MIATLTAPQGAANNGARTRGVRTGDLPGGRYGFRFALPILQSLPAGERECYRATFGDAY